MSDVEEPRFGNQIYQFLGAFYLHQDRLGWERIYALTAIEAAAVAGIFTVRSSPLAGIAVAILGFVLTWLFWGASSRDWEIRDHLRDKYLDKVHDPAGIRLSPETRRSLGRRLQRVVWLLYASYAALVLYFGLRLVGSWLCIPSLADLQLF